MSDLVREAKGLMAGMALLEELEPASEISCLFPALDLPEQLDLECRRFVNFLHQLKISSDGQSVTCPFQHCVGCNRIPLGGNDRDMWDRELASHCWSNHAMHPLCFEILDYSSVRNALEKLYVKLQEHQAQNSRLAALLAIGCVRMPSTATVPLTERALQTPVRGSPSQRGKQEALASNPSRKSKWEQFRVLRSLRLRFLLLHRKLLHAMPSLRSETLKTLVRDLGKGYSDPGQIFDTWLSLHSDQLLADIDFKIFLSNGMGGLMDLLEGRWHRRGGRVGSILALFCLGSAMADTMKARGKNVDFNPSGREVLSWGSQMEPWERVLFENAVEFLWPRLADDRDEGVIDTLDVRQSLERLLEESQLDEDFLFASWLETSPDIHNSPVFYGGQHSRFPREAGRHETRITTKLTKDDDPHDQSGTVVQPSQTAVLHVAVAFLIFLSSLGIILHYMSENLENVLRLPELLSAAGDKTFSAFVESARSSILDPLCLHGTLKNFQPIFRTASKILEGGWLPSVRHLEKWLLSAIKPFATTKSLHICAVAEIIHLCSGRPRGVVPEQQSFFCDNQQESGAEGEVALWARVAVEDDGFVPGRGDQVFEAAGEWDGFSREVRWSQRIIETSRRNLSAASASPKSKRLCATPGSCDTYTASESLSSPTSYSNTGQTTTPEVSGTDTAVRSCDIAGCGKVFKGAHSLNSLARHRREKHSVSPTALEPTFHCPAEGCTHKSHRRHNLRDHWERKHSGLEIPASLIGPSSVSEGRGRKRKSDAAA